MVRLVETQHGAFIFSFQRFFNHRHVSFQIIFKGPCTMFLHGTSFWCLTWRCCILEVKSPDFSWNVGFRPGVEVPQSHTSPDTALAVWARRKWSVMFHVWDFADETCYTITFVCFYVFLSSHSAKIPNYWNCRLKTEMGMVNLPSNCIFDWEYAARTSVDTPYAGCRFLFRFACQGSDGRGVSRTGALIGDTFGMCGWCRVNWLLTLEVCTVFMLDFFF